MAFDIHVFYLRLTHDISNGIENCTFTMVDKLTNFHNVWDLLQRNLFSIATALDLHDSTGIPYMYTSNYSIPVF